MVSLRVCFVVLTTGFVCGVISESSYYEDSWKVPLSPGHKTALANYQEAQPRQSALATLVGTKRIGNP